MPELTDWLASAINHVAGKGKKDHLTLCELKGKQIDLRVTTTDLSTGRALTIPFDHKRWIFDEKEFAALFPPSVVAALRPRDPALVKPLPAGYTWLTLDQHLPVVFLARLSLSFPVLLKATPMWQVRPSQRHRLNDEEGLKARPLTEEDLERHWLSDGGICSNFPIHFFDRWLPERPTFGIGLTVATENPKAAMEDVQYCQQVQDGPGDAPPGTVQTVGSDPIRLRRANETVIPVAQKVSGLGAFLLSIFSTAQNHADDTQSELAGVKDRIVQIPLRGDEGGLNLDMHPTTLTRIQAKGVTAGQALLTQFNFDEHRWVRFVALVYALQRAAGGRSAALPSLQQVYNAMLQSQTTQSFGYPRDPNWWTAAHHEISELIRLLDPGTGDVCDPRPSQTLRVVRDVDQAG